MKGLPQDARSRSGGRTGRVAGMRALAASAGVRMDRWTRTATARIAGTTGARLTAVPGPCRRTTRHGPVSVLRTETRNHDHRPLHRGRTRRSRGAVRQQLRLGALHGRCRVGARPPRRPGADRRRGRSRRQVTLGRSLAQPRTASVGHGGDGERAPVVPPRSPRRPVRGPCRPSRRGEAMSTEQPRALAATIPTTEVIKDAVTFPRDRLGEPLGISDERFEAWLRSVRRDAAREALDGLAEAMMDTPGIGPGTKTHRARMCVDVVTYRD